MIFGNVKDQETYRFLPDKIQTCFSYINNEDMEAMDTGTYVIDGENLFVNIVEYETKDKEICKWEAHKKYIDIHVLLKGQERIDLNFIDHLKMGAFVEKEDFLPLEGNESCIVKMAPNDFLICFPEDGHMTGIVAAEPERIKKAIFKVQI